MPGRLLAGLVLAALLLVGCGAPADRAEPVGAATTGVRRDIDV